MVTPIEPGILDCEVKWALGSVTMNKANAGDRIPAELFQILVAENEEVLNYLLMRMKEESEKAC